MNRGKRRSTGRRASPVPAAPIASTAAPSGPSPAAHGRWPILLGVVAAAIAALVTIPIACGSRTAESKAATAGLPPFDSNAAWNYLTAQMGFGVRPVGTPAHEKLRDYLAARMHESTSDVQLQQWTDPTINLPLTNVIARFPAKSGSTGAPIMLCTHWDTRPTADFDPDVTNRAKPIPGADDGASGTAVLLELAPILKATPPPVPVWLVFLDGEDYGPGVDRMFIGSRYLAKHQPPGMPKKAVLLDMIGNTGVSVPKEQNSQKRAPALVDEVWAAAKRTGHQTEFPDQSGDNIMDDHLPLLDAGVACIDLIDFSYAPWHTLGDTADKCSPRSLGAIGETMVAWIYGQKRSS
jgi:glutaminyl-peptide cyclotransferase